MFNLNISCFVNSVDTDQLTESQPINILLDHDLHMFPLFSYCKYMKKIHVQCLSHFENNVDPNQLTDQDQHCFQFCL